MRKAAILGYAAVPVGIYQRAKDGSDRPLEHEFGVKVVLDAVEMAGLGKQDLDGVIVAHPGDHTKQGYFHTFLTAYLGLTARSVVMQVLGNGMTAGLAFDQGLRMVQGGETDSVLVVAAHFESGTPTADHLDYSIRLTGDVDFQSIFGAVPISWYAMGARRYMHDFKVTRAETAEVAVKNRRQAVLNPLAQFRTPITLAEVLAQRMIVDPLGLLEVPGRADGAVALVIVSEEIAKASGRPHVLVRSRGFFHEGEHQIADHPVDITDYQSIRVATRDALERAGMALDDIGSFQLYAPCTIVEILASESMGLFPRGEGWRAAADGTSAFDGARPVNTSGGHLSRGHPPEATPLYDVVEACEQVLGRAGDRQVKKGANVSMTVSELGNYNAAIAHILEGRT
jgi:acetyl-CoA C-acetyltransferase